MHSLHSISFPFLFLSAVFKKTGFKVIFSYSTHIYVKRCVLIVIRLPAGINSLISVNKSNLFERLLELNARNDG